MYNEAVFQARLEVDAKLVEGRANCRRGQYAKGVLGLNSDVGKCFEAAYAKWMALRARAGDPFARSLGY